VGEQHVPSLLLAVQEGIMIQGDQENTAQEPLPLGIFIHLMGWIGRISLVWIGIWVLYKLAWYGACIYGFIIIISLVIVVSLLEKLNRSPENQEAVLHYSTDKNPTQESIYHLAMIPFVLIVIGFGLYVVLTFLSIVYQLLLQAPLLLGVSLIATPTILLILNYLMDLKFWNK
jgi:hypothetical protein